MFSAELKEKIKKVLSGDTQEKIVLECLLENGSVTVRDLVKKINYPCGPIRDLQNIHGILLEWEWEESQKIIITSEGKEKKKKSRYKRYRIAEV